MHVVSDGCKVFFQAEVLKKSRHIGMTLQDMTPERAGELLARNRNIRRIDPAWVHELALRILEGSFELRKDGIDLDIEGNLINGQHRLSAIIESGKTVPMYVHVWECKE